uniref:Secreted protein n=1 Tax=Panagrellus redivivus TaxID=6233 RepID=A0A7E4VCT3_PANRE
MHNWHTECLFPVSLLSLPCFASVSATPKPVSGSTFLAGIAADSYLTTTAGSPSTPSVHSIDKNRKHCNEKKIGFELRREVPAPDKPDNRILRWLDVGGRINAFAADAYTLKKFDNSIKQGIEDV